MDLRLGKINRIIFEGETGVQIYEGENAQLLSEEIEKVFDIAYRNGYDYEGNLSKVYLMSTITKNE